MITSGWAIKYIYTNADGAIHTGLLVRHYFGDAPPRHFSGYQTAVFRTRQQARDAARRAGRGYDHATAVRVYITVEEPISV